MRGRVDHSEGLIAERPQYQTTPNLIQKPDYNQAIIKTFRILERSPSPTFGDVVHPVCIVEDLRGSLSTIAMQGMFGVRRSASAAPNFTIALVVNRSPNPLDVVRVDRVRVMTTAALDFVFIAPSCDVNLLLGRDNVPFESITLLRTPRTPAEAVPPIIGGFQSVCPTMRYTFSDDEAFNFLGSYPTGFHPVQSQFLANSTQEWIEGPFILFPGFGTVVGLNSEREFTAHFQFTELPG